MLFNDNKNSKKNRQDYQRAMKRSHPHRGWRWLPIGAGGLLSAAAAVLMAVGVLSFISRGAEDALILVTNAGKELKSNTTITVMDGAQVFVKDYTDESNVQIFYRFYDQPLADPNGMDFSSNGTRYTANSSITLNRSTTEGGTRYLYIQRKSQTDSGTESIIYSYTVKFFEKLGSIESTPATSDSNMTSVKVGDTITFSNAALGTMYYTDDGTQPSFVRDSAGTITINGEKFRLGSAQMKPLGSENSITVTEDWLKNDTRTIRVISCKEGYDFGTVCIFRFKVSQVQAQAPTISPATTAENPTTVNSGTPVTLRTSTKDGVILYTKNGSIPRYTVVKENGSYKIVTSENTYEYTMPFSIKGKPGDEIIITAITVKISTNSGVSIMKDSNPVQFIYNITPLETAAPPEATPESGTELALNSKIYLNTPTSDGVILYTTDGSSPDYTVSGNDFVVSEPTKVYGAVTSYIVAEEPDARHGQTFLIQAKTVKIDRTSGEKLLEDSAVRQFAFKISEAEQVAEPTATPKTTETEPAVIKAGNKIMLSCTTAGASIYYTLDGTAPVINADNTLAGTTKLYHVQDAIEVPAGIGYLTVTAMARKDGMNDSSTVQFNYRYPGTVAPPYVTPVEGTVSINTEVTLASLDKKAQIYYTLDGSQPTATTGRLYSEPILLTQDTVIKAICELDGISSAVKTFTFKVAPELLPPAPSIANGAVLTSGTTITLTAQKGAQIYYTLDGSSPKDDKAMVGNTVTLTGKAGDTITLTTYAKGSDYSDSQTATYVYTISNYENGIKVNPEAGSKVKAGDVITLETDVTEGTIYFAVGGDSPESNGLQGTQVIVGESGEETKFTLKATVVAPGSAFTNSIASFVYEYMEKPVAPKASVPNGAVLLEKKDIVLSSDSGDIYYTLNGAAPDSKSNIYTEPISVTEAVTIRAITISGEGAESEMATFSYTFAEQVQSPVFSINSGEVEAGTLLTISSATPGAVVYYTTDGQIPDLNNPKNLYVYSGAIVLNKPVNIKAMAVKDRMANSEVVSAIYTVKEPEIIIVDEEPEEEGKQGSGNRLVSRRAYMNETEGPTYSDFVIKSAATGVVISAEEGAIPAETKLSVAETAVDSALNYAVENSVGQEYGAVASYEISLMNGTEEIQPAGDIEIGLPIPAQYRNSAISVAYVNEDGNVEIYETRRDNDMAYAHITHFSRYCIVAPVNFEEEESEADTVKIISVMGIIFLAGGYILLRLGRKRKKEKGVSDE